MVYKGFVPSIFYFPFPVVTSNMPCHSAIKNVNTVMAGGIILSSMASQQRTCNGFSFEKDVWHILMFSSNWLIFKHFHYHGASYIWVFWGGSNSKRLPGWIFSTVFRPLFAFWHVRNKLRTGISTPSPPQGLYCSHLSTARLYRFPHMYIYYQIS